MLPLSALFAQEESYLGQGDGSLCRSCLLWRTLGVPSSSFGLSQWPDFN